LYANLFKRILFQGGLFAIHAVFLFVPQTPASSFVLCRFQRPCPW
jgi:hypothetical protein